MSFNLPQYCCHKIVRAAKIGAINPSKTIDGWTLDLLMPDSFPGPDDEALRFFSVDVSIEYAKKHQPKVGGYYVQYKDGYASFSPAEAFEEGYTLIE